MCWRWKKKLKNEWQLRFRNLYCAWTRSVDRNCSRFCALQKVLEYYIIGSIRFIIFFYIIIIKYRYVYALRRRQRRWGTIEQAGSYIYIHINVCVCNNIIFIRTCAPPTVSSARRYCFAVGPMPSVLKTPPPKRMRCSQLVSAAVIMLLLILYYHHRMCYNHNIIYCRYYRYSLRI